MALFIIIDRMEKHGWNEFYSHIDILLRAAGAAASQLLAPHGQVAVSTNWPCGHPVRPPGVIGGVIHT